MIMRWINNEQYICFNIAELFAWQDELDKYEYENQEKAWELFNDFLWEAENQLEYSEEFIRELEKIHNDIESGIGLKRFVSLEDLERSLDDG